MTDSVAAVVVSAERDSAVPSSGERAVRAECAPSSAGRSRSAAPSEQANDTSHNYKQDNKSR